MWRVVFLSIDRTKDPLGWLRLHGMGFKPQKHTCLRESWDERLHIIEETIANIQFGLTKYRCPCTWCHGGGKVIL
jgi:hypothetical protein